MIYFAKAEGTNLVKIGFATSVERRLLQLQAGCPHRLTIVRVTEGDRGTEAAFHALFAEHHLDREWFNWSPRMAAEGPTVAAPPATGSFAKLIADLGGPTVVAARTGIGLDAVKKMSARNKIAAWHWPTFQALGIPAETLIACQRSKAAPDAPADQAQQQERAA